MQIGMTISASGTVSDDKVIELREKSDALLEEFKAAGATGAVSFTASPDAPAAEPEPVAAQTDQTAE